MASIKPLGAIAQKFAQVTPSRAQQYAEGVAQPRRPWAAATAGAEGNYEQGVTLAITRKSFGKGVRNAGDAKFLAGATTKGARNFGPGVAEAGPAYERGFAPYHQAISSLTLPQRYTRRDPRNLLRVAAIDTALGKLKESKGG